MVCIPAVPLVVVKVVAHLTGLCVLDPSRPMAGAKDREASSEAWSSGEKTTRFRKLSSVAAGSYVSREDYVGT